MLSVLKNHINRLVFEQNLLQSSQIDMMQLSVEHDFATSALADSGVGCSPQLERNISIQANFCNHTRTRHLSFLVRLEFLDSDQIRVSVLVRAIREIHPSLIHTTISAGRKEALSHIFLSDAVYLEMEICYENGIGF